MTERSFGQMVREARLERHLSMGQLAAAVDRSTASVRRWERDEGLPSEEAIETLILRRGLDRRARRTEGHVRQAPVATGKRRGERWREGESGR